MVVICKKKSLDEKRWNVINNNLENYIEIGDSYTVYGIRICRDVIYYCIFSDQRHLIEVPSGLFEITNGAISPHWEIQENEKGITFWPSLFYKEDFFENFSEWEDKERNAFMNLSKLF